MKNNLEQIQGSLFRKLDETEQLGFAGGSTSGPTIVVTGPVAGHPDILADFREDPPV
jgi:hypothetical protein